MDSTINVLYASDDNYAPIAGVSITSLFENNQDAEQIRVLFLANNISEDNINKLQRTADKYHRIIEFIDARSTLEMVKDLGAKAWFNGSYDTYSRLFLENYIDNSIERILYLDCDTICAQSISKLWQYDLEGKTMGMVCDYIGAGIRDVIGLKRTDKYYNGGVLLIDMKQWRANNCGNRILQHMKNVNSKYPFVDQDIINIVMKDEIKTLPWIYNVFPYYFTYTFKNIQKQYDLNEVNQYSLEEYESGLTPAGKPDAKILHYTATFYGKPWYSNSSDPTKEVWNRYYEMSEWEFDISPMQLNYNMLFSRVITKLLPQYIYIYIYRYFSRRYMRSLKTSN